MRSQAELENQAEENNRRVKQAAEAAALLLFLRRSDALATAARSSLVAQAAEIRSRVDFGIREARMLARKSATDALRVEVEAAGLALPELLPATARLFYDAARARLYASRYARSWLTVAQASSAATASAATAERLRTTGKTEAASAFNEWRHDNVRLIPHVMRMWDARNDSRTCRACAAEDGTMVGANESFPLGEPGSVHPNCLCTWHLLTVEEVTGR